jgi:hypothetical protein
MSASEMHTAALSATRNQSPPGSPGEEWSLLPEGTYQCQLVAADLGFAKTGTPRIEVQLLVIEGAHEGRRLWHHYYLTVRAMGITRRGLAQFGITTWEPNVELPPDPTCFDVDVCITDYEGRKRNCVKHARRSRAKQPVSAPPAVVSPWPLPERGTVK